MMKAIKNIKVITTEGIIEDHAVVYDQTIREILPEKQLPLGCRVVDGGGAYLAPGLIDTHTHGDPLEQSYDAFLAMGVFIERKQHRDL